VSDVPHATWRELDDVTVRFLKTSALVRYVARPDLITHLTQAPPAKCEADRVLKLLETELDRRVP
jgi:hypothetical protein